MDLASSIDNIMVGETKGTIVKGGCLVLHDVGLKYLLVHVRLDDNDVLGQIY